MYLLDGIHNTLILAPYCPKVIKDDGGYEWAGNYKLMHALVLRKNRILLRPNGRLTFPEGYTIHQARYDYYKNREKVVRPTI